MGQTVRGSSVGNSTELGMSMCSSKIGIILIGIRGCHQNSWKEAEYGSHVEELDENGDLDEPTSILDHVYLGCTQRECT